VSVGMGLDLHRTLYKQIPRVKTVCWLHLAVYKWSRYVFIARVMCGLSHVTVAALCCSCSLLCISNSDRATENEAGRVNGNEEPADENCHQYSSVVTAIIP